MIHRAGKLMEVVRLYLLYLKDKGKGELARFAKECGFRGQWVLSRIMANPNYKIGPKELVRVIVCLVRREKDVTKALYYFNNGANVSDIRQIICEMLGLGMEVADLIFTLIDIYSHKDKLPAEMLAMINQSVALAKTTLDSQAPPDKNNSPEQSKTAS